MSLINDMLRDLEARKALSATHVEDVLKGSNGLPAGHIEAMHHTDVTPSTEKRSRRTILIFFGFFLAGLLSLAVAIFSARPGGVNAIFARYSEAARDIPPAVVPSPKLSWDRPQRPTGLEMPGTDSASAQGSLPQDQASPIEKTLPPVAQAEAIPSAEEREDSASPTPTAPAVSMPLLQPTQEQAAQPAPATAEAPPAVTPKGESSARPAAAPPAVQIPARKPRLVMVTAHAQEQGLRLDLAFDAPMRKAIQLRREGDRVELLLPDVSETPPERPHHALQNWQTSVADAGLRIAFLWPMAGDVRLRAGKDEDGLQHWGLWLAFAPSSSHADGRLGSSSALASADGGVIRAPSMPRQSAQNQPLTAAERAEALYAEAWQLQQKGRTELALEKLRQAVQIQPEHAQARELLVRLLLRAGQPRAAEIELVRGLEIQPRQPELVELMARLLADQGRGQEALGLLRDRMQVDRLAHQALFAALAARAGDHAGAAEAYRHAAELDPRDPRWPLGRAIALENTGQLAAARAAYAQALALEGLDAAARVFAQERLQHLDRRE